MNTSAVPPLLRRVDPASAERWRAEGWWRDRTTLDDFLEHRSLRPDKVAVVSHRAEGDRVEVLSYRQLGRLVDRFAGALIELGVRPGDVVSFQLPNWWEFVALHLAITRVGGVTNAILPILRKREVGFILERVESRICIAPSSYRGFDYASMLAEVKAESKLLEHVFIIGGDGPEGTRSFADFFEHAPWERKHTSEELDRLRPSPDALSQIQYTSGTTGEPKGVMHTQNTMYSSMAVVPVVLGLDSESIVLMASPMAHQTGFLYGCSMPMSFGMKVVLQDVWDPKVMLRLVEEEQATWTMGATPFVVDACRAAAEGGYDTSSLKYFVCAGAPIPPQLVHEAASALGTKLIAAWGMTEIGVSTICSPSDPPERIFSSDGAPAPWMQARIVDEADRQLGEDTPGRLQVRGAALAVDYFKRPDLMDMALTADGWFDTGDLARVDSAGYIRITGRAKDLIIRGGENIPVLEVEAGIYSHPSVAEVAVVSYPDDRLGERACAIVVPANAAEPPSLADLTAHLDQLGMAKQFWPERLEIRSELPKTASGKVQKYLLREDLRR